MAIDPLCDLVGFFSTISHPLTFICFCFFLCSDLMLDVTRKLLRDVGPVLNSAYWYIISDIRYQAGCLIADRFVVTPRVYPLRSMWTAPCRS